MKKIYISLIMLLFPLTVLGYSEEVYLGGDNIGIEVKTKGVLVIGLYKVNNSFIASSSGIEKGDYIVSVNNNDINSIDDLSKEIEKDPDKENLDIKYKRNKEIHNTTLKIEKENDEYKTGLYVKDSVSGIGTLTLIDPEDNRFLALGHAVLDNNTNSVINIDSGSIYSSYITSINKSDNGSPGEKVGESDINNKYGIVSKNTEKGIFGTYEKEFKDKRLIEVGKPNEIKTGKATIMTVLDKDKVMEYEINISSIDYNDSMKNILFEITDTELLSKTGGIVQGMSGSPIIQNNKIIGAVTHVIVDDCKKGYGIFITNMLEESERE